jgi:succinate-acetate transporter protein
MQRTPVTTPEAQLSGRPIAGVGPPTVQSEMGPAAAAGVTIADPAPLGLAAFGLTTLLLMVIQSGWLGAGATIAVIGVAAAYGGTAQLLAGMWAFRRGNTFAATAFSSYGAFWISYFLIVNFLLGKVTPASTVAGFVGLYTLAWGIFTCYMTIASLGASKAVTVVFVLLTATYFLLCANAWSGNKEVGFIAGYVGVATAVAALYASFADVTNASFKRVVLPVGTPFVV